MIRKFPKMNRLIFLLESTFQKRAIQRELDSGKDVGREEGRDVLPYFVGKLRHPWERVVKARDERYRYLSFGGAVRPVSVHVLTQP